MQISFKPAEIPLLIKTLKTVVNSPETPERERVSLLHVLKKLERKVVCL